MPDIDNEQGAIVKKNDLYGKKTKPVVSPERKNDIDLNNTLYDNIVQAGLSSQIDINSLNTLPQKAQSRNDMYNVYDVMCEDGSIGAVVETYAEDATERNDSGRIVWVSASDDKVAQLVEYFLDSLNIDKNIYKWCYSLCKYGDLYLRLYRESEYNDDVLFTSNDEINKELDISEDKKKLNEDIKIKAYKKNDSYAHYMEMVSNPATMFELTRFGKTIAYIQSSVKNTVKKNNNTTYNTFDFQYKFKKQDVDIYPPTEFVHACLEDNTDREEESVSIFLNQEDYDSDNNALNYKVKKGQSLLESIYSTWRQLQLLEASVLLNRVTKSSIIRLINVEVGDMPKENIPKVLMNIKQLIEQKAAINAGNSMSEYTNPGPVENNVYIPTHEGVGAITTTQVGGDVDIKSLADLDYYLNKLYGQLRVPKQYFSQTDDSTGFNGGTSLSIISSRYAKMIKRIQNTLIQAITDAINLMLIDKGLDSYVNEFKIQMMPPTTQEEIDRRENISGKVQLTSDIMNMLSDIDDESAKLKILKVLLSSIIDDPEILNILQEQIDITEEENKQTTEEDFSDKEMDLDIEKPSFNSNLEFGDELGGREEQENSSTEPTENEQEQEASNEENILPSPEDIGVDLNDTDEE